MKTLISYIFVLVSLLFSIGCDSNFEEINSNPNDPTTVSINLLLAGTLRSTTEVLQSPFNAAEGGSCWVQHLGKTVFNDNELYIPRLSSLENTWFYLYAEVAKEADLMQNLAELEGNNNLQGVALVIKANAFHILTDTYGDVPFTEALKAEEGLTQPIYDDSETVIYPGILNMLDEAIALLDGNGEIDASQDLLYGGDYTLWKKYASSLKFKVLMRAASGGYDASTELQELIIAGNLFSSNNDEAKLVFLESEPNANPFYEELEVGNQKTHWVLGEELVNYMTDTNDPRLPIYGDKVGGNDTDNGYVGKPAGIRNVSETIYGDHNNLSLIGELYREPTQPCYFMTYSHLCLLMAEAVEKGYISGNAEDLFHKGIEASVENNGVTGLPDINYANATNKILEIQKQIWVSTFMQGFEAWAEWRRTGVPVLPIAVNAIDAVDGKIPKRYKYPPNQQSLNNTNYTNAVSKLSNGDSLISTLWWQNQ